MSPTPADSQALYQDLVREHSSRIWRLGYRLTGDRDDAEDLTQETYYEAWRSLCSSSAALREPAAGRSWLVSIMMHRASRRLRQARSRPVVDRALDDNLDASPLPEPELDLLARREDIQLALDAVDPERRIAFLLVFLEGLTCREAAERLAIPLGTVLSRIHRARGELRSHLRRLEEAREREARDAQRGSA